MHEDRAIDLAKLPSVDTVLRTAGGTLALQRFGHQATVGAIRNVLRLARAAIRAGGAPTNTATTIADAVLRRLQEQDASSLRRVFNLTGTVLHTNLGRAVLPESAVAAAAEAMRSPVTLEFDVADASRGERDDHVRGLIRELTGAEDAVVVNNNAAAVLLLVNTFAAGKEAVV